MDLAENDQTFLRNLVKAARQKHHHVTWVDRDGSERHSTLSPTEVVRLNALAARLRISKGEILRQAAHIPVAKLAPIKPIPSTDV